jgi:hypothetical protein
MALSDVFMGNRFYEIYYEHRIEIGNDSEKETGRLLSS